MVDVQAAAAGGGGGDAPRRKIRLASGAGGTFGVDDIAVAWADSGGFWKEEGLEVEWTPVHGGVRVVAAVVDGTVDAGYGTWVPCVKSHLEGRPVKILASMALALAQNLLARKDRVASVQELKGKRWAVDGIGALSHTLAQLIARGLGFKEGDIEWVLAGPPPQRIEQLLSGEVDCSLVRVEEALALSRQHPELLCKLLGFEDILPLAPTQPHGVLSVTAEFATQHPEACAALASGLIRASRSLHESLADFRQAVRQHVTERPAALGPRIDVNDEEIEAIWQREHDAGSFAVNGGLTAGHWAKNMQVFSDLYGDQRASSLTLQDVAVPHFVDEALRKLGAAASDRDTPAAVDAGAAAAS